MRISIFGDSIMEGVRLENGKYIRDSELIHRFEKENNVELLNRSRFGATIAKGERSLKKCCENGELGDYTLIEFGGNDCDHNWAEVAADPEGEHPCATPEDEFVHRYSEMIEMVRSSGSVPVVSTLPPISAERYFRWICRRGLDSDAILEWLGSVQVIEKRQALFSRLAQSIAEKMDCIVLDLRSAFPGEEEQREKYLCEDGIHPNLSGQQLILNKAAALLS